MAQALLPVRVSLHLCWAHSQEWLCHLTFSAASKAPSIQKYLSPSQIAKNRGAQAGFQQAV